jgi:hypothetical protein
MTPLEAVRRAVAAQGVAPVARTLEVSRGGLTSYLAGACYRATRAWIEGHVDRLEAGKPKRGKKQ